MLRTSRTLSNIQRKKNGDPYHVRPCKMIVSRLLSGNLFAIIKTFVVYIFSAFKKYLVAFESYVYQRINQFYLCPLWKGQFEEKFQWRYRFCITMFDVQAENCVLSVLNVSFVK